MKRITTIVLLSMTCCLTHLNFAEARQGDSTLYKATHVFTGNGESITPGQVLVTDGKIISVGQTIEPPAECATVDLGDNSTLIPGLVNAYTHAGSSADETTREVTPEFRTIDSLDFRSLQLRQQMESGVTTACVCPGTNNVFSGIAGIIKTAGNDRLRQTVNEDGPLVATLCADPAQRNQARQRPDSIYVRQPTNRMGVVWLLRSTFDKAGSADNRSSLINVKRALSQDRQIFFVSRKQHDMNAVVTLADEFGFSPILVGGHESNQIVDLLVKRQIPVVINAMTTGAIRGEENTELCWNLAGVLSEAGVPFCLSGENLLRQARFAHRFGLDEQQALASVTSSPAKLLGINDRVGMIAEGMDADMVAIDGNPLEFTSAVKWVMVDGELIDLKKEN